MSIANSQSNRHSIQLNESIHSRSKCEIICKMQEEMHDQEQSYMTAPRSLGISVRTNRSRVPTPEEQRHGLSVAS